MTQKRGLTLRLIRTYEQLRAVVLNARLTLYLTPLTSARVVIPRHACEIAVHVPGARNEVLPMLVNDFARDVDCATIQVSSTQAVLDGPAMLSICGRIMVPHDPQLRLPSQVELRASISPAGGERKLPLSVSLSTAPTRDGNIARWASRGG